MLLLPFIMRLHRRSIGVAIPYSSGMLLLQGGSDRGGRGRRRRRNPLFIGNAFATDEDTLAHYTPPEGRNPLFIGNAFATGTVTHHPQ